MDRAVVAHLSAVRALAGSGPVGLGYWRMARRVAGRLRRARNPLYPPYAALMTTGHRFRTSSIQGLLAGDTLGEWALDAVTIEFLWRYLQEHRPQAILECGAGVSTVVLAAYAGGCPPGSVPAIASLEQDLEVKRQVERRLAGLGLQERVGIAFAPVNDHGWYDASVLSGLPSLLHGRRIDCLLIDGPFGPPGCRFAALPTLAAFCADGARWFLDDAFRDGELEVLDRWQGLGWCRVEGIYAFGKGLATGVVRFARTATTS